jgi:hypothetical protein
MLDHLSRIELDGAYRRLCGALLYHASSALVNGGDEASANRWLEGECGAIPFDEACEACDLDPAVARNRLADYVRSGQRRRRRMPRSRSAAPQTQ